MVLLTASSNLSQWYVIIALIIIIIVAFIALLICKLTDGDLVPFSLL